MHESQWTRKYADSLFRRHNCFIVPNIGSGMVSGIPDRFYENNLFSVWIEWKNPETPLGVNQAATIVQMQLRNIHVFVIRRLQTKYAFNEVLRISRIEGLIETEIEKIPLCKLAAWLRIHCGKWNRLPLSGDAASCRE